MKNIKRNINISIIASIIITAILQATTVQVNAETNPTEVITEESPDVADAKAAIREASTRSIIPGNTITPTPVEEVLAMERFMHGDCAEWRSLAIATGWEESEWKTINRVMFRESRCLPYVTNEEDPMGGSFGLLQINGFWCKPSRWTPNGFLQDKGVLETCADLYDPAINLLAARAIWQYGEDKHGCGWKGPWLVSCKKKK